MPHGALWFLETSFHIQNSITSGFDIWQPLKIYHYIIENQDFNFSSLYGAKELDIKMKSLPYENLQWFCDGALSRKRYALNIKVR